MYLLSIKEILTNYIFFTLRFQTSQLKMTSKKNNQTSDI